MISPETISYFSGKPFVKVSIPTRLHGILSLDAAVKHLDSPFIDLEVHPSQIPHEEISAEGEWLLTCEHGALLQTVRARLHRALGECLIRLEMIGSTVHGAERVCERVDADVYLKIEAQGSSGAKALKQKVNLSDCGVRFVSAYPLQIEERLRLEIVLPGSSLEVIHCEGRVVWVTDAGERGTEAALEIERIEAEDRSKLQAFCMAEQFRRMQSKVRVLASFLAPSSERLE